MLCSDIGPSAFNINQHILGGKVCLCKNYIGFVRVLAGQAHVESALLISSGGLSSLGAPGEQ